MKTWLRLLPSFVLMLLSALVLSGCLATIPQVPCTDANCQLCRGYGNYRCNDCFGRGRKQCNVCNGRGMTGGIGAAAQQCFTCSSSGMAQCWSCNGRGMRNCTKPAPGYGPQGYAPAGYAPVRASSTTRPLPTQQGGYRPPPAYPGI